MTDQKKIKGTLIAAISLLSASLGVSTADAGSRGGDSSGRGSSHGTQNAKPESITASGRKGPSPLRNRAQLPLGQGAQGPK